MTQKKLQETIKNSKDKFSNVFKSQQHKPPRQYIYEDNPDSYAYGINRYKLAWLFVCGSLMGYVAETIWYLYLRGKIINRQGVLYGPFSPIYGVMFVLLTCLLYRDRLKNWKRIFLTSMLSVTAFEYACSWLMEHILGTKSWSYAKKAFNINGRVCLQMSIMWGILGLLFIKFFYPLISRTIENFKPRFGKVVGTILFYFLVIDCIFSFLVSLRQTERRNGIEASNAWEEWIDDYYTDEKLAEIYTEIRIVKKKT